MSHKKDVGMIHDAIFAISNLVALEWHCLEGYSQNPKDKTQLEIAEKARAIRSKWMYRIVPDSELPIWCESKHLLAIGCALKEMGNRFLTNGDKKLAEECYNDSQEMEAIFIILNQKGGEK